MTKLTSYDLQQAISKKFVPSLESEQEIEIETDEVIINQTLEIDTTDEDLAESINSVNQNDSDVEAVDQASESLESLIIAMESSVLTGGFDVGKAQLANITLESISRRFDLPHDTLSFGLEATETDGEAETKSTIGKAKNMLTALKDSTGELISKMYMHAAAALGNTSALSDRILSNTAKIRSAIDMENKGDTVLTLKPRAGARLSINGTPLKPEEYLKELKRSLDKYNEVVKAYSDNQMLEKFVQDVISSIGKTEATPKSKSAIVSAVKNINQGITKPVKVSDGVVAYASEPYLGNYCIVSKKPDAKEMVKMFNESLTEKTVSQEGIGEYAGSMALQGAGAMLFYGSQLGFFIGTVGIATATGVPLTMLAISMAVVSYYGTRKGVDLMKQGFDGRSKEVQKAVEAFRSKLNTTTDEASTLSTEFSLSKRSDISMEASKSFDVQALNPKQIQQALALIDNTAMTSRNLKKSLASRKALIKQVDSLMKEVVKAEGTNNAMSKAAATFVKKFLKQSIKFETDITKYGIDTMRASINYIGLSNSKLVRDVIASMNMEEEGKQ